MLVRAAEPDDAAEILRIAREHELPASWTWPPGKHGLVVEYEGRVAAFCVLSENPWGLLTDELWQERSRQGDRALSLLSRQIEQIAQRLADERGEEILAGGTVHLEREGHIRALKRRGYREIGLVLSKTFKPNALSGGLADAIGAV